MTIKWIGQCLLLLFHAVSVTQESEFNSEDLIEDTYRGVDRVKESKRKCGNIYREEKQKEVIS